MPLTNGSAYVPIRNVHFKKLNRFKFFFQTEASKQVQVKIFLCRPSLATNEVPVAHHHYNGINNRQTHGRKLLLINQFNRVIVEPHLTAARHNEWLNYGNWLIK